MPFVVPSDEVADLEFASKETPKTPFDNTMHSNPNEDHSDEVMFANEGASAVVPQFFTSLLFSFKAFLIKARFGLRNFIILFGIS